MMVARNSHNSKYIIPKDYNQIPPQKEVGVDSVSYTIVCQKLSDSPISQPLVTGENPA
jgi:hypothetical protein